MGGQVRDGLSRVSPGKTGVGRATLKNKTNVIPMVSTQILLRDRGKRNCGAPEAFGESFVEASLGGGGCKALAGEGRITYEY